MSIGAINRAVAQALAGKGSVEGCTMSWERGEDRKQRQRLNVSVVKPDGERIVLTGLFDGQANLEIEAVSLAKQLVIKENIPVPSPRVVDATEDVRK